MHFHSFSLSPIYPSVFCQLCEQNNFLNIFFIRFTFLQSGQDSNLHDGHLFFLSSISRNRVRLPIPPPDYILSIKFTNNQTRSNYDTTSYCGYYSYKYQISVSYVWFIPLTTFSFIKPFFPFHS